MKLSRRLAALTLSATAALLASGCTTTSALISLTGVATDTSITWEVVKHIHQQLTEGDPRACVLLNSAQRAVSARCGAFVPGSIVAADIERTGFAECSLALAARDPRLWPALGELMEKGARPGSCAEAPLVQLAQRDTCPDFTAATAAARDAIARLATTDPRSVHHDVVRLLSCPQARAAGLDSVLATWRARGDLQPSRLAFGPLGALHPDYLDSAFARQLEADGHTARGALGAYEGVLRPGFEEALRTSHWAALDWWLQRAPELANRVPPLQGNQLAWIPLARVVLPTFLAHPERQKETVEFLLARGADPRQRLPSNPNQSVLAFARTLKSPMVPFLEPAAAGSRSAVVAAAAEPRPARE
jgi:hypothetical protein